MTIILFLSGQLLKYHIERRLLRPCTMGGIHLAEVPFDAQEDVSAHHQAIGIFFIIGGDGVAAATGLVQDVKGLEAQGESADVPGHLGVPAEFRPVVAGGIAPVCGSGTCCRSR